MSIHIQASDFCLSFAFLLSLTPWHSRCNNPFFPLLFIYLFYFSELEDDVADDTLDHYEPLPSTSRGRSDADIALDRAMVFRYDAALDLVFKEEFTEQPEDQAGEENAQQQQQQQQQQKQQGVANEPRRKRPRYGNYELLFPESEEQEQEEEEEAEAELQTSRRRTRTSPPAASEQLPFNHPAIKKEKGRSTHQGDN